MHSTFLVLGIMVGVILVVIFLRFINRDKKLKTEYDERQKSVRGRSYMYAFYGTVFANCIFLIISTESTEFINLLGMNVFFIPILIGIIIQFSYSIFNDGYIGLNNNMVRFMVGMSLISAFNIVIGILEWTSNGFIRDGKIFPAFLNLEVGVMFIILCIDLAIKKCIDKKADTE